MTEKTRGRPRVFDRQGALETAMELFWKRGYEGATVADLSEAMGVNRPSLYAAFGNKEALFVEALALYEGKEAEIITKSLNDAPSTRQGIEAVLRYNAGVYAKNGRPPGCMIVLALLVGTPDNAPVRNLLAERRRAGELELRERIERGQSQGDVPATADAAVLASFYTAVLQGMSITARDGARREALDRIVSNAMSCWPDN